MMRFTGLTHAKRSAWPPAHKAIRTAETINAHDLAMCSGAALAHAVVDTKNAYRPYLSMANG